MEIAPRLHNTWMEIDLDALIANYQTARDLAGPGVRIAAVLKANAYGHGMLPVASALLSMDVDMLAVSCLREALVIRRAFAQAQVLVMGLTPESGFADAVRADIHITIETLAQAQQLSRIAQQLGCTATAHVKLDTGFHRIGLLADENAAETIAEMAQLPNLCIEGVFTHLALKDEAEDHAQMARYEAVLQVLEAKGVHIPLRHAADSISLARYPQWQLDLVRVGAMLYGVRPNRTDHMPFSLRRTMCVKARIVHIAELNEDDGVGYDYTFVATRKTRIATLQAGYGDGFPRRLSNRGEVALHSARAKIVGLLCMDQMMIDVTDIPQTKVGDVAVLLGGEGVDAITYEEYSAWVQSNRNEPLSAMGARLPRVYMKNGQVVEVRDDLLGEVEI